MYKSLYFISYALNYTKNVRVLFYWNGISSMSLCSVEKNKINQYVIKKIMVDKSIGKQI